jgi:hypothetical protein
VQGLSIFDPETSASLHQQRQQFERRFARYLALFTSRISAVRWPHRLHVTQRFRSSSRRPGPYCILSFTRLTFAERRHESQNA